MEKKDSKQTFTTVKAPNKEQSALRFALWLTQLEESAMPVIRFLGRHAGMVFILVLAGLWYQQPSAAIALVDFNMLVLKGMGYLVSPLGLLVVAVDKWVAAAKAVSAIPGFEFGPRFELIMRLIIEGALIYIEIKLIRAGFLIFFFCRGAWRKTKSGAARVKNMTTRRRA